LEALREAVNLRAYGQHEPLVEYRQESYRLFKAFQADFQNLVLQTTAQILANPSIIKPATSVVQSIEPSKKVGRNDLCPCGSGKKYKKCHGK